jgi:predicted RNA-binding Zn-ribbon protein involved in translation (DUF1610 family)
MALIECAECQKQVSDTVKACPNCGFSVTRSKIALKKKEQEIQYQKAIASGQPMPNTTPGPSFASFLIGISIVSAVGFFLLADDAGPEKKYAPKEVGIGTALATCQNIIAEVSKYPAKADVPFVQNQSAKYDPEYYFAWGPSTKHAMLMNGLGLMAPTSASCNVNRLTGKITALTINGKTVL